MNEQEFYYSHWKGRMLGNRAREELILKEIEALGSNDSFLEVGCAQGHFEKQALKKTQGVFGADFSLEKLEKAKGNAKKAFFVATNAERLPFKSKGFDFVLCTEVLEHVPDWKAALKELQRVARKKILITVPLEKGLFWRAFSLAAPMSARQHLHKLDSKDVKAGMGKEWHLAKRRLVGTQSRRLNRLVKNRLGEKLSIFSMLLFEKKKKQN